MIRSVSLVCLLALLLLPLTLGAQSNPQYPQDRTNVSQPQSESQSQQSDRNLNQSSDPNAMQNRDTTTRSGDQNDTDPAAELPATAGELPLLALIGALALAGAAGTRLLVRVR
jgi:hypothetical protein